ncbi:uncharacterized protein LOC136758343 [Amia ocellicauda]|uniref:uncharacterized protein LOC136758343 n=1 Tax=Amia ocellicauda TaxID=2972642 RepID=UPI003464D0DD
MLLCCCGYTECLFSLSPSFSIRLEECGQGRLREGGRVEGTDRAEQGTLRDRGRDRQDCDSNMDSPDTQLAQSPLSSQQATSLANGDAAWPSRARPLLAASQLHIPSALGGRAQLWIQEVKGGGAGEEEVEIVHPIDLSWKSSRAKPRPQPSPSAWDQPLCLKVEGGKGREGEPERGGPPPSKIMDSNRIARSSHSYSTVSTVKEEREEVSIEGRERPKCKSNTLQTPNIEREEEDQMGAPPCRKRGKRRRAGRSVGRGVCKSQGGEEDEEGVMDLSPLKEGQKREKSVTREERKRESEEEEEEVERELEDSEPQEWTLTLSLSPPPSSPSPSPSPPPPSPPSPSLCPPLSSASVSPGLLLIDDLGIPYTLGPSGEKLPQVTLPQPRRRRKPRARLQSAEQANAEHLPPLPCPSSSLALPCSLAPGVGGGEGGEGEGEGEEEGEVVAVCVSDSDADTETEPEALSASPSPDPSLLCSIAPSPSPPAPPPPLLLLLPPPPPSSKCSKASPHLSTSSSPSSPLPSSLPVPLSLPLSIPLSLSLQAVQSTTPSLFLVLSSVPAPSPSSSSSSSSTPPLITGPKQGPSPLSPSSSVKRIKSSPLPAPSPFAKPLTSPSSNSQHPAPSPSPSLPFPPATHSKLSPSPSVLPPAHKRSKPAPTTPSPSPSPSPSPRRVLLCQVCERPFLYLSDLQRHSITHSQSKPHACPHCGKAFKRASHLQRHRHIHSGQRRHACPLCAKRFREPGELLRHQRVHTGEKPYQCAQCHARFAERNTLRRHAKRKHGESGSGAGVAGPGAPDPPEWYSSSSVHSQDRGAQADPE